MMKKFHDKTRQSRTRNRSGEIGAPFARIFQPRRLVAFAAIPALSIAMVCSVKPTNVDTDPLETCLLRSVRIISMEGANDDSPTAVDIVAVKSASLAAQLSGKDAFQWFKGKDAVRNKYSKDVEIYSAELVPLSDTIVFLPYYRRECKATVLLFARYKNSEGRANADITKYKDVEVILSGANYSVRERGKGGTGK